MGSTIAIPFAGFAKRKENNRNNTPFGVEAGKDRFDKPINLFEGDTFYTKVSTKDTDGDMYIFESTRVKKEDRLYIIIILRMNGGIYWKANLY